MVEAAAGGGGAGVEEEEESAMLRRGRGGSRREVLRVKRLVGGDLAEKKREGVDEIDLPRCMQFESSWERERASSTFSNLEEVLPRDHRLSSGFSAVRGI